MAKGDLSSPKQLAFKEDNVKVTLSRNRASFEFFKAQANQHHTAYQKMIRNLLDAYALQHAPQGPAAHPATGKSLDLACPLAAGSLNRSSSRPGQETPSPSGH